CLVEYDICNRNFSKQMKYANKKGYKYVVVIGDKEVKSGEAKIKDLRTGKEEKIKF
ncbi:MAG: histidine--tRNA ligase, partial [Candidatus Aenigmarchaeota archaeon]|nr:histidine--tRNA ligase [Candidatus Aenigmarchaeota archaeon]